MAGVFGTSQDKRFTIDDAFEEENDEAVKVYGSTTERSPLKPKSRTGNISEDSIIVRIENPRDDGAQFAGLQSRTRRDDSISRDSDSLIQDGYYPGLYDPAQPCWKHPKIQENWKMVLAAAILLFVGSALLITGITVIFIPLNGVQSFVFFIVGLICFVPGAYHVVYIYLAVKGKRGYDFYHLPLFN